MKEVLAQYVQRSLSDYSMKQIHKYCHKIGVTRDIVEDLHTTIVYSIGNGMQEPKLDLNNITVVGEFTLNKWDTRNGTILVLTLNDSDNILTRRNDYFKTLGSNESFPEYKPHISLTYFPPLNFNDKWVGTSEIMTMTYGPETYEDIYEEWKPKKR